MADEYHTWRRGATLTSSLSVSTDGVDENTPIYVAAKKVRSASTPPPEQAEDVAFVLDTVFIPATGEIPARWKVTAPVSTSLTLELGVYLIDAAIELNGEVTITASMAVQLVESVTGGIPV